MEKNRHLPFANGSMSSQPPLDGLRYFLKDLESFLETILIDVHSDTTSTKMSTTSTPTGVILLPTQTRHYKGESLYIYYTSWWFQPL